MCGRFSLFIKPNELQLALDLGQTPPELQPNDNIPPGTGIPVVIDAKTRNVEIFYWGLAFPWMKNISLARRIYNARCETIAEKSAFKNAFLRRRCLIPATGYYEWKKTPEGKIPCRFSLSGQAAFMLAGIWEYWMDANGNELYSTAVATCPAAPRLSAYHDRMPLIFNKDQCWQWMESQNMEVLSRMMRPYDSAEIEIEENIHFRTGNEQYRLF